MALNHNNLLYHTLVYIYSNVIIVTVTTVIISISEFLWISAVEDEGGGGVGDVIKIFDGGGVSAA